MQYLLRTLLRQGCLLQPSLFQPYACPDAGGACSKFISAITIELLGMGKAGAVIEAVIIQ